MSDSAAMKAYRKRWLGGVAVFVAFLVAGAMTLVSIAKRMNEDFRKSRVERTRRFFNEDFAELKAGKKNNVYFYDTGGTDEFVGQLEGVTEVEELGFELTDLSETGMASIAKLPRLRKLLLYGGRSINNAGLAKLKGMTSLEDLELVNTQITDDGLRLLEDIPNLRVLTIYCEPRLQTLTPAGMTHLGRLKNLKTLKLSGGWYSSGAVEELKMQLPKLEITGR